MRIFAGFLLACSLLLFAGCSSVQTVVPGASIPSSQCDVKVFATLRQAERGGPIEEMCVISGTSSMSFIHTVNTAINKHKNKACKCGADNVYVQSQRPMVLDVASVTMVAFRYLDEHEISKLPTDDQLRKAKLCQAKGGLWINDVCQISVD